MILHRVKRPPSWVLGAGGFTIILGLHLVLTTYYLNNGFMGADEGFYALAARNVMDGKIPYRDFGYTQMPLLPYLNGAMMKLAGFGMTTQRILNIIWSCLGLAGLILGMRHRLGRWEPGFAAAFCVVASPQWSTLQAIGTSHGATGMFVGLATGAYLSRLEIKKKIVLTGFFLTAAAGCRLSVGPVAAIMVLGLFVEAKGIKQKLAAILIPALLATAALLPFYLASPTNAVFNTWYYHMASVFNRRVIGNWIQWWTVAPAAIIVLLTGLFTSGALIKRRLLPLFILLVAALAGVTLTMIPRSSYGLYITPCTSLAAAAGMTALWTISKNRLTPFRHVVWLLPLIALYHDLPNNCASPSNQHVVAVADFINENAADGPILTPLPMIAVEAGRDVIPGTEMGMFSAMDPKMSKRAKALRYTTIPILTNVVKRKEPAAIALLNGRSKWNFLWRVPTLRRQPKKIYKRFSKALAQNYQRSFNRYNLVVYLPK